MVSIERLCIQNPQETDVPALETESSYLIWTFLINICKLFIIVVTKFSRNVADSGASGKIIKPTSMWRMIKNVNRWCSIVIDEVLIYLILLNESLEISILFNKKFWIFIHFIYMHYHSCDWVGSRRRRFSSKWFKIINLIET